MKKNSNKTHHRNEANKAYFFDKCTRFAKAKKKLKETTGKEEKA